MFITELFLDEISDELRRSYLDRAGRHVDRRQEHMARVRDRLNKGYEIYHADRPANGSAIVDRFEADTPALARQYYERFIHDYESDQDFDLRLRRSTGIIEGEGGLTQTAGIGINGKQFNFSIKDLIAKAQNYPIKKLNPQLFVKQLADRHEDPTQTAARAQTADLQYPIIVVQDGNTLMIADGTHRAQKAIMNKLPAINARIIPSADMVEFSKQGVTEAFDRPYPITWEHSKDSHDALAKLPDGTNLSIMFSKEYMFDNEEDWHVEFWRNNSQEVTGEGDAQRVFATVLSAIQQFIKTENPERIRFSASKDQEANSRTNLYSSLVRRYANTWGYEVDSSEYGGSTVYNLYKLYEQDLNEAGVNPMRQQAGKMIDKYFGQIYSYGDSGLDYLDNHAPIWFKLSDQYRGDIDVIIATAPVNLLVKSAQELKNVASDLGYELDEASGTPQYVTRIDSTDIKDFSSNMPTYYHTKDWSQSGQFKPGSKIPKNFSGKVQGTFAGDPHRTALYATGNAGETRFVEITDPNGQSYVYFDKKDLPTIRARKTYLTVFPADTFKVTNPNTGEYFSSNPGKPIKQEPIADPFQYITSQGWIIRITDDLSKVLAQAKQLHKQNKIKSYGGEGLGVQENLNEITAVPTVAKSKRQHLDVMPNDGRPIPKGEEAEYLGKFISKMPGGYELWGWSSRWDRTYFVFDPETRISQLATTGKQYPENPDSFVVVGVYSGPKNQYRAADLYAFLIRHIGLTLVSDNKQSEGGYRVWQELERRYGKTINVHGFDTRTDKGVNVTTQDEPDTHVSRADVKKAGPQGKKELATISRDLRFVASAK